MNHSSMIDACNLFQLHRLYHVGDFAIIYLWKRYIFKTTFWNIYAANITFEIEKRRTRDIVALDVCNWIVCILHKRRAKSRQQRPTPTIGSNDLFYLLRRSRLVRISGIVYFCSLGYIDIRSIYLFMSVYVRGFGTSFPMSRLGP